MSDVMLLGVLRMPISYVGGPLSPMAQFVARAREAADRISSDADKITELRAKCESLRKDAERYRWLRKNAITLEDFEYYVDDEVEAFVDEQMAAANVIDAAMNKDQ